jgi:arginine/lysine/histidine/glutamine transport system substrate-binding and permease protein
MVRLWRDRFLHQLIFGFIGLFCAVTFAACSSNVTGTDVSSSPTPTILNFATEAAYPPFEFQDGNGSNIGFDIDLIKAIAEAGGFSVKFQNLPFDGIIPALQSGKIDGAISAITIKPERAKVVDFSRPYFKAGLAVTVRVVSTSIKGVDDLRGKKIAVQVGTTGADKATSIPGAQVRTFGDAPLTLQELSNGNVDAAINDAPILLYAIKTGNVENLKVLSPLLTEEYYGIALPKGSANLEKVNQGLTALISNGKYAELYQKWFGEQPPQLPEKAPEV